MLRSVFEKDKCLPALWTSMDTEFKNYCLSLLVLDWKAVMGF